MITRLMFAPALVIALALPMVACGGGETGGDNGQGDTPSGSEDAQGSTDGTDPEADGADGPTDGATGEDGQGAGTGNAILDCMAGSNDMCAQGISDCMASDTCQAGLECIGECGDATCAQGCLEGTSDADTSALQGLITCAAFGGCFDLAPDPVDPVCGDGTCDEGEDAEGCPDDCGAVDISCIQDNCELGNCVDVPQCAEVITCMGSCESDACVTACIAAAPPEAEAMLTEIATCATAADCFVPSGPETVCGDGACEGDETCESCAGDCGECPVQTDCCTAHEGGGCTDEVCVGFICEMDATCCDEQWHEGCAATALAVCDVCQSTCGDGVCEAAEDSESCPDDCVEAPTEGCIAESCDLGGCLELDICADVLMCMEACDDVDCAEACLATAPGSVVDLLTAAVACGVDNGCLSDGPKPPNECVVESCETGNCEAFPDCASALECMKSCDTTVCAEECVLATPATFHAPLYNLIDCGVANGCLTDPNVFCGDGECTGLENYDTCPGDCPPVCGDDVCMSPETAGSCPDDCEQECGDFLCTHDEDNGNCPADCPPECGDDVCTAPADGIIGETAASCAQDCPAECGDTFCTHDEDHESCSNDCPPVCGDGFCSGDAGETAATCVADCPADCGDDLCTFGETQAACPDDCEGVTEYYGVLIRDDWNGACLNYNAAGADIASVELVNCPTDDPAECEVVAYFQDAIAEVGTEGCTNGFQDPSQAEGPCGCEIDQWISLQGGWVAGGFGENPITTGMMVRVYEYGADFGG
ncbi:MAG: hypothetical protein QF464_08170, partial [Myxococcota bacterium]|nr:hypothetical protein [Myxococcota bacterium]